MKLLLVDDDDDLRDVTAFALRQAGFLVVTACDGIAALETYARERPDLAVLDVNMPRMDGFELAGELRRLGRVPIIVLTVRGEEEDVVRALGLGADDYLTKPFSPRILVARVRALLRRAAPERDGALRLAALTLRPDELVLERLGAEPLRLTPLEARFLQLLFANAGRTVVTERILSHVWGNRAGSSRQLLKQLVHRLRQKLERDPAEPRLVRTVPNAGYVLDPEAYAGDGPPDGTGRG